VEVAIFIGDASPETAQRIAEIVVDPVVNEHSIRGHTVDGVTPDDLIGYVCSLLPHAAVLIDGVEAN
jgi:hypothetical protein